MVDDLKNAHWSCRFGHVGPYGCKPGAPRCLDGLEYHVWRRGRCGEAVIAFRGTDANEIGDWLSNFRWFIARRLFDQYDQVQKAVPDIIGKVNGVGCSARLIVATGHSLGGGLAQHAGYADKRIEYVYAFDPSPVTAFFGVPLPVRSAATEHLGIDRVYEAARSCRCRAISSRGCFRRRNAGRGCASCASPSSRRRASSSVTHRRSDRRARRSVGARGARQRPLGFAHATHVRFRAVG